MSFSFEEYLKIANEISTTAAETYRASFIPDSLFKFYYLSNEDSETAVKENEKRLKSFRENKIWFSSPSALNDPYEMKGFFLNEEKLFNESGIAQETINSFKSILLRTPVAAFTENMATNLPMWAHYANTHQGYCVKYMVKDKHLVRAVHYFDKKPDFSTTLSHFLGNAIHWDKTEDTEAFNRMLFFSLLLQTILFTKHISWKYEKEYRVVFPMEKDFNIKGLNVPCDEIGLVPTAVYTGINCNDENKEKIRQIASKIGIDYHNCQMSDRYFTVFDS